MNSINIFKDKRLLSEELLKYGFEKNKNLYTYKTDMLNGEFQFYIEISHNGSAKTEIKEKSTQEIYTLHLLPYAEGDFIGKIKDGYESIINDIKTKCFETGIFEWEYTYKVIDYCKKKYANKPEYLWKDTPRNAIIRRKDNKKWYLALLSVNATKLGLKNNEIIEVINLRVPANEMQDILKNKNIYPAYHMNKKNWITIILDGSVQINEIYHRIDTSYKIVGKK